MSVRPRGRPLSRPIGHFGIFEVLIEKEYSNQKKGSVIQGWKCSQTPSATFGPLVTILQIKTKTSLGSSVSNFNKTLIVVGPKKFGQNWARNSKDIVNMDKCCLVKYHHNSWHLSNIVPETYLYSLVKIESVTAEIFPIWTNVARTNLAWTNVNLIVRIC